MITALGALAGFIAVALGAFGAHALQSGFDDEGRPAGGKPPRCICWSMLRSPRPFHAADGARFGTAALTVLIGATVFAGTLYAMALGAPRWLGAITPIGGVGLLIGWGLIAWAALKA